MKLYCAGPMTGYPDYNYPAFHEAAKQLREAGYEVVNPAELDEEGHVVGTKPWEWYVKRDLKEMLDCDGVALLDGWTSSKGARLEQLVAWTLGMLVGDWRNWIAGKIG